MCAPPDMQSHLGVSALAAPGTKLAILSSIKVSVNSGVRFFKCDLKVQSTSRPKWTINFSENIYCLRLI